MHMTIKFRNGIGYDIIHICGDVNEVGGLGVGVEEKAWGKSDAAMLWRLICQSLV